MSIIEKQPDPLQQLATLWGRYNNEYPHMEQKTAEVLKEMQESPSKSTGRANQVYTGLVAHLHRYIGFRQDSLYLITLGQIRRSLSFYEQPERREDTPTKIFLESLSQQFNLNTALRGELIDYTDLIQRQEYAQFAADFKETLKELLEFMPERIDRAKREILTTQRVIEACDLSLHDVVTYRKHYDISNEAALQDNYIGIFACVQEPEHRPTAQIIAPKFGKG